MYCSISNMSRQHGAILLLFALILLTGSTYTLIVKLNSDTNYYIQQGKETQESLRLAKQALIAYAVNFPEIDAASGTDPINGPGYLPCPDISNDGSAGGTCSFAGNTTIGRLPYRTLEVSELRDSSGARLWYALSDNFRNSAGLEPLNSETDGQLSVDGNGDVVAVVIAPGAPIGNQNRDPSDTNILTEIANYLEMTNNDLDLNFISIDPSPVDFTDFNDRLIAITRQELMDVVEKRMLGEVKLPLADYRTVHGAYPWLSPFADPKTNEKKLTGEHSGANNQTTSLTDSSADFTEWGIVPNVDVVWNITDGSYGVVTGVAATTLTVAGGLSLGSENDFDTDDEYFIDISTYSTAFTGTAISTGGSAGLMLEDTTKDFDALGIQVGDIVDLVADGSSGVIESVTSTTLTVSSLTGATTAFSVGLNYRIRTSVGRATANTDANGLTLEDTNVDFTVMGVQIGDLVRNITDGSYGRITAVTANRLTVAELNLGTNNTFSINDYYQLPRYNSITNIREGLLPIHEPGEVFHTSFNIDWGALAADGSTVTSTQPATDPKSEYSNASNGIKEWAERSRSNNSGTIAIAESDGQCTWINSTVAECTGTYTDTVFLSGRTTSVTTPEPADGNEYFYDTNQDFDDAGVYEGDKVENLTNGTIGLVDSASSTGVHFMSITGETPFSISTGDGYRISVATKRISNTADASTDTSIYRVYDNELSSDLTLVWGFISTATAGSGGLILEDITADFITLELEPGKLVWNNNISEYFRIISVDSSTQLTLTNVTAFGVFSPGDAYGTIDATSTKFIVDDTVVENSSSDGQGLMTKFGFNWFNGGYFFEYTPLQGGSEDNIDPSDTYRILYDYVDRREYDFNVRINSSSSADGGYNEVTTNGLRQRNVCLGYSADCSSTSGSDTTLPGDSVTPMVTIRDYNSNNVLVGDATVVVPVAGSLGRVKVAGLNLFLSEEIDNLPAWYINNDWHELVYASFSAGFAPGAAATCTAGTDCLTLTGSGTPNDNKNALVIAAGMEINTTLDSNCNNIATTAQNRANGTINEYYESGNCNAGDDNFQEQFTINTFNDQVRVVEPSP